VHTVLCLQTFVPSPESYEKMRALCPEDPYIDRIDDQMYRAICVREEGMNDVLGYFIARIGESEGNVESAEIVSCIYTSADVQRALEQHACLMGTR
jgi:hypothetical protein